jgi:predicted nucleotidyltransferase
MTTALGLTQKEMETYRAAARRRLEQEQHELEQKEKRAWELAHWATALLRERFGASRVVVFGSLVHKGSFSPWSDVDIAAWGIRLEDTFRAIGAVMDLDAEIEVNLVDVNTCSPEILASIEQEGVEI